MHRVKQFTVEKLYIGPKSYEINRGRNKKIYS
jgi:hypothetical protein